MYVKLKKYIMSLVSSILLKIKKCLNVCGTNITDLLKEYCNTSSNVISSNQLSRALNDCGANLSPVEIQDLEIEFKYGDGISIPALISAIGILNQFKESNLHSECFEDLISLSSKLKLHNQTIVDCLKVYDRSNKGVVYANDFIRCFGNSIESQRIAKSFMNPETKLISLHDLNQSIGIAFNSAKIEQAKEVPQNVRSFISLVIKKRIDLRSLFQSYDKIRSGKIPTETFTVLITSVSGIHLIPQEIQEIIQYYYDSNGLVNYLRLCQDIDFVYQRMNNQQKQVQPQQNNIDVQTVMNRLKKTAIERRISISDIFPKTPTEKLSQYVFSRILSQNNLGLTNQEVLAITFHYTNPQSKQEVDYQRFLSFFVEKKVEKPFADIKIILEKISRMSTARHSDLKGTLLRFDRDGSNIMPAFQFLLALQYIGINLNPNEINEICRVFPGNYPNSISLQSFICAISPYIQKEESLMKLQSKNIINDESNKKPVQVKIKKEGPPPQVVLDIISKISYTVLRRKISLIDDFKNLDKARHNTIKKNSYFEYITSLNAGLSIPEIRVLFEYYIQKVDEFDYISFNDDVNNCIKSRFGNSNSSAASQTKNINSNENISPELQSVLYRIRALEIKKMIDINDLFFTYDQMKNGTVPCKIVNSVFTNIGLLLKSNEFNELIKNYTDNLNKELFHYRKMANALSTIKLSKEKVDRILYPEYFEAEMERELCSVRPEIKEKLHVRRKNVYMVYANVNGSLISEEEFFNRLSNAGIILMKPQREALMKNYSNPGTGEVDYKQFCDDVENSSPISI